MLQYLSTLCIGAIYTICNVFIPEHSANTFKLIYDLIDCALISQFHIIIIIMQKGNVHKCTKVGNNIKNLHLNQDDTQRTKLCRSFAMKIELINARNSQ